MIGLDCICLYRDTSFVTYHPSYTQIGHFMGRETVYCKLNNNMVEGVGCPVLASGGGWWSNAEWIRRPGPTLVWRMDDGQKGTGETVNDGTSVGGGRGTEMEVWLTGSVTGRSQKARAEMKGERGRREEGG